MADKHIHLIPKPIESYFFEILMEMVMLGEQTKSEPAADNDILFTLCCAAKSHTESSTRYWNGVKQFRGRMRKVPVKRVFIGHRC